MSTEADLKDSEIIDYHIGKVVDWLKAKREKLNQEKQSFIREKNTFQQRIQDDEARQ